MGHKTTSDARKSAKLPAYLINWISISNIRCKLKKYGEEEGKGQTIEHHLSSLLSKFPTGDIKNKPCCYPSKVRTRCERSSHKEE